MGSRIIEIFDSTTGWTGSSSKVLAYGLNQIPDYIAGINSASLIIQFKANALGEYIQRNYTTNSKSFRNMEEVTFSIWSRNKKSSGLTFGPSTNYAYKIDFIGGSTKSFYIPMPVGFDDVTFNVSGLAEFTSIRITALTNDPDYLIISNMVTSRDELPLDIFQGIKDSLTNDTNIFYGLHTGSLGTTSKGLFMDAGLSGSVGDDHLNYSQIESLQYAGKYAVILIDDGVNSEVHQIDSNDESSYKFTSLYDGPTLINSYSSAVVYLVLQSEFGFSEKEILVPGIVIDGMAPEEIIRTSNVELDLNTYSATDGSLQERPAPVNFKYQIELNCFARQKSILGYLSQIARRFIAKESFWVNGKRINIRNAQPATYIPAPEGFNEIPVMQFQFDVEIRENVYDNNNDPQSTSETLGFNIATSVPIGAI